MPLPLTPDVEELRARFAFWRAPGVGPKLMQDCLRTFSSIKNLLAYQQPVPESLAILRKKLDWRGAEEDLRWLDHPCHHVLFLTHALFPRQLAEISSAPPFIFVHGAVDCLHQAQISIVGSRNPTHYGIKVTEYYTEQLVTSGFVITSGLALGIDAIAHQKTLAIKGKTIAVLAVGLDRVYPRRHQALADQILADQGALVSEFGIGMQALKENFPRRNRLISGLSIGVLVTEAAIKSGSLITARFAAEQGREVFAVPGSIFQPLAQGCHALIKQGAKCVECIDDILEELPVSSTLRAPDTTGSCIADVGGANSARALLNDQQRQLFQMLHDIPQSFEELIEQVQWPSEQLQIVLSQLLIQGLIQKSWHGYTHRSSNAG